MATRSWFWLICLRQVGGLAAIAPLAAPVVLVAQVTNSLPNGPGGLVIQGTTLNNSIAEQLPNPPLGTLIFTMDPGCFDFQVNQFVAGSWIHPNQRIVPGQGVLTWNPGESTNNVSAAQPATLGQYSPAQSLNLLGLLPGDSMLVDAQGDILRSITVISNSWQTSEIAFGYGGFWEFLEGDEGTLRNGSPFTLETYDSLLPIGNCPPGGAWGSILLNSYVPASGNTGTIEMQFPGFPDPYWRWSRLRARLYVATSDDGAFDSIGPVFDIQPDGVNGKVVLPGPEAIFISTQLQPGQEVLLELRVWDSSFGESYEIADLVNEYGHGRSSPLRVVAQTDFSLPPTPVNLNQFPVQLSAALTPKLTIFTRPDSAFVATGAAAKIDVMVTSYAQSMALQWQKLGAAGLWEDLPGETTRFLNFSAVSKAQQGKYRVRATALFMDGSSVTRIGQVSQLQVASPPVLAIDKASPIVITLSVNVDPEYRTTIERLAPTGAWEAWQLLPTGSSIQAFQLEPMNPSEAFRARTFP